MTPEQFWERVQRGEPGECWPWTGCTNGRKYGRLRFRGKYEGAHRVAFELATGRRPQLHVLHSCDNPPCCNPAHLREGTDADNCRDMFERGRASKWCEYPDFVIALIRELHEYEGWTAEQIWILCKGTPSLQYIRAILKGRVRHGAHVHQQTLG